jgi:hypothetical protein
MLPAFVRMSGNASPSRMGSSRAALSEGGIESAELIAEP